MVAQSVPAAWDRTAWEVDCGPPPPPLLTPPANGPAPPLLQEHTGAGEGAGDVLASLSIPTTGMAKNLGSSGGSATLQRSKLSNARVEARTGPKLDDGMGGGGIGKGIFNGGGGDGDGGDDDDYFNEFGDGDGDGGDDGFFRKVFKELYDAKAIQAVLQVGWAVGLGRASLVARLGCRVCCVQKCRARVGQPSCLRLHDVGGRGRWRAL